MIEAHVQLDVSLGGTIARPGKHRCGDPDQRRVQGKQLCLEAEPVMRCLTLGPGQEAVEDVFEQRSRLSAVDPRQAGPTHRTSPKVVELVRLRVQIGDQIAQARPARQLSNCQGEELIPAANRAQLAPPMVLAGGRLELMSR